MDNRNPLRGVDANPFVFQTGSSKKPKNEELSPKLSVVEFSPPKRYEGIQFAEFY